MKTKHKSISRKGAFVPAGIFRKDIAGIRALAVIAVVIFHMFPAVLPGGFVGVDIFFVLSGFLIGGLLWREFSLENSVSLRRFYARRFRRLLPASLAMIVVVTTVSFFIYPYWLWEGILQEAVAASLYAANVLFAYRSADYFTESLELPNPLLHMWTLGLEEQFYFILPVVLVFLIALSISKVKQMVIVGVSGLTLVSFLLSLSMSSSDPSGSFFLIHTRFWEFSVGVLAAVFTYSKEHDSYRVFDRFAHIVSGAGLIVLLSTLFLFNPAMVWPGYWAAVPVFATLAILVSRPTSLPQRALSVPPAVWVGNISYSWYLWHYAPIIFLSGLAVRWGISADVGIIIAGFIGFALAVASYYLIENPIRYKVYPEMLPGKIITASIAISAAVAIMFATGLLANQRYKEDVVAQRFSEVTEAPALREDLSELSNAGEPLPTLESEAEEASEEVVSLDGLTVLIVGDSHAEHWEEAVKAATVALGGTFVSNSLWSCPAIDVYVTLLDGSRMRAGCEEHRAKSKELAADADIIILSQAEHYINRIRTPDGGRVTEEERLQIWQEAYRDWLTDWSATVPYVGVFTDNPKIPGFNPADCVRFQGPVPECNVTAEAVRKEMGELPSVSAGVRISVFENPGTRVFDVYSLICDDAVCKTFDDVGEPIFSDNQHLTSDWTMKQIPLLKEYLLALVNSGSSKP